LKGNGIGRMQLFQWLPPLSNFALVTMKLVSSS